MGDGPEQGKSNQEKVSVTFPADMETRERDAVVSFMQENPDTIHQVAAAMNKMASLPKDTSGKFFVDGINGSDDRVRMAIRRGFGRGWSVNTYDVASDAIPWKDNRCSGVIEKKSTR